jgi:hypothetical protein
MVCDVKGRKKNEEWDFRFSRRRIWGLEPFEMYHCVVSWDFNFSRRRVWCSELFSGIYDCRQSFYTAVYPRRQLWTLCSLGVYRRFRYAYCLHHQDDEWDSNETTRRYIPGGCNLKSSGKKFIDDVAKGWGCFMIPQPLPGQLSVTCMITCEYVFAVYWYWQPKMGYSERNLAQYHHVHYEFHTRLLWVLTRVSAVIS